MDPFLCTTLYNEPITYNFFAAYSVQTSGNYVCSICKDAFKCAKGLEIHINKIHETSPRLFPCPQCPKSFKSQSLQKVHQKQVHEKISKILCAKCQKYFCNKFTLQKHCKKMHPPTVNIN